ESDSRKAAFLAAVARETGVFPKILNERAEALSPANAQILSARALAPLTVLLGYAERHLAPGGKALFPKGAIWRAELEAARQDWVFEAVPHPSKTDSDAVVLEIKGVSRG
ncbi:MAG: class I SAM-dependent methyltransferase, partial [Pseudorhodobacter sp.]|nr:class I SAM-dependent methyltransferase [Pseudorhodobacter sp.]